MVLFARCKLYNALFSITTESVSQSKLQTPAQAFLCSFSSYRGHLRVIQQKFWADFSYTFIIRVHHLAGSTVWIRPVYSPFWSWWVRHKYRGLQKSSVDTISPVVWFLSTFQMWLTLRSSSDKSNVSNANILTTRQRSQVL